MEIVKKDFAELQNGAEYWSRRKEFKNISNTFYLSAVVLIIIGLLNINIFGVSTIAIGIIFLVAATMMKDSVEERWIYTSSVAMLLVVLLDGYFFIMANAKSAELVFIITLFLLGIIFHSVRYFLMARRFSKKSVSAPSDEVTMKLKEQSRLILESSPNDHKMVEYHCLGSKMPVARKGLLFDNYAVLCDFHGAVLFAEKGKIEIIFKKKFLGQDRSKYRLKLGDTGIVITMQPEYSERLDNWLGEQHEKK